MVSGWLSWSGWGHVSISCHPPKGHRTSVETEPTWRPDQCFRIRSGPGEDHQVAPQSRRAWEGSPFPTGPHSYRVILQSPASVSHGPVSGCASDCGGLSPGVATQCPQASVENEGHLSWTLTGCLLHGLLLGTRRL